MAGSVERQRVIVTGAGSGIGKEIARRFWEDGAKVHLCDLSEAYLDRCVVEMNGVKTTRADVSDDRQVVQLFEEATAWMGGLDVLVNNVGIAGPTAEIENIRPEAWERTMAVNLNSQFYCIRQAVPHLKASGGGSIVNISSTAGLMGYPLRSPYTASKWAIIGLTKTLAMELGQHGIRVNAICPGSVGGERIERVIAAEAAARGTPVETMTEAYRKQSSMGVFIDRADIAHLILFLCSPMGRYISGQALAVDGHTESLRSF